jgi:hypothetical protein
MHRFSNRVAYPIFKSRDSRDAEARFAEAMAGHRYEDVPYRAEPLFRLAPPERAYGLVTAREKIGPTLSRRNAGRGKFS